jgi:hypothetical protein
MKLESRIPALDMTTQNETVAISSSSHQKSEKFEDNKGIVRNSSSKNDRQCNGKEKKT